MDKLLKKLSAFCEDIAKRLFERVKADAGKASKHIDEYMAEFKKGVKKSGLDEITLSKKLYKFKRELANEAQGIIREYLKGQRSSKKLAKLLYEGYNFKDDPLKITPNLPKYLIDEAKALAIKKTGKLKTPALKAAYLEALEARNSANYDKKLKVALYEKGRYYAKRIAITEAAIEYNRVEAQRFMEDNSLECVKFVMSHTHPRVDICDYYAELDAYGLGAGIYPKDKAPTLPLHPFCRCKLLPKYSIKAKGAKLNKTAEQDFINSLPAHKQAQILGSRERAWRFKKGDDFISMYNESKPERYKIRTIGEMLNIKLPKWVNKEFKISKALSKQLGIKTSLKANIDYLYLKHPEMFKDRQEVEDIINSLLNGFDYIKPAKKGNALLICKALENNKMVDVGIDIKSGFIFHINKKRWDSAMKKFKR